jgi:cation transport ATPase
VLLLSPAVAHVRRNGEIIDIPVSEILSNETVIVKPGERIPVDGTLQVLLD